MKKILLLILVLGFSNGAEARNSQIYFAVEKRINDAAAFQIAETTLRAHGGEKFRAAKTIVLRGSVEVSAPNSAMTLPAAFSIIYAGDKYRFELTAPPVINFLQTSDGTQTYSSMPGFSLPPVNRLGLPLLARIRDENFTVSGLPAKFSKKKGFRITSPEGFFTDFVVDEKTGIVKEYESSYEFDGRLITTSVAVDKYREVGGALVNENFSQRLETGQFTAYAKFKAREILLDTQVADDAFVIAK